MSSLPRHPALFRIRIEGIDGKGYDLDGCDELDSINVIKRRIESVGGVRVCQQKLYAGELPDPLRNHILLRDAGIRADSSADEKTLCLVIGKSSSWMVDQDEHEIEIFDAHDEAQVVRTNLEHTLGEEEGHVRGQSGDDEHFRAFTLSNLLSPKEVANIVEGAGTIGFENMNDKFPDEYRRSNDRVMLFSEDMAEELYNRLLPHLCREDSYGRIPIGFGQGGEWKPHRLNECIKVCRYRVVIETALTHLLPSALCTTGLALFRIWPLCGSPGRAVDAVRGAGVNLHAAYLFER
jgi:hypothetical protein